MGEFYVALLLVCWSTPFCPVRVLHNYWWGGGCNWSSNQVFWSQTMQELTMLKLNASE